MDVADVLHDSCTVVAGSCGWTSVANVDGGLPASFDLVVEPELGALAGASVAGELALESATAEAAQTTASTKLSEAAVADRSWSLCGFGDDAAEGDATMGGEGEVLGA
jgi:hypothetical protein